MPTPDSSTARPTTTESPPPLLVSVDGMARMLGVSRREAYRLLEQQHVESRWRGRRRLVPVASIEAFVAALPTERQLGA